MSVSRDVPEPVRRVQVDILRSSGIIRGSAGVCANGELKSCEQVPSQPMASLP